MQFQVPQFIETEDKIVGPLTLKQFLYLAAGGGVVFVLYTFINTLPWIVLSALVIGITASLAFVKVNGQGMPQLILAAFNFYWRPQVYVWQPSQPSLPKNAETLKVEKEGFSLENIVAGMALKNAWRYLQTGSKAPVEGPKPEEEVEIKNKERYQVVHELTGERRVAKRIDYR